MPRSLAGPFVGVLLLLLLSCELVLIRLLCDAEEFAVVVGVWLLEAFAEGSAFRFLDFVGPLLAVVSAPFAAGEVEG